MRKGFRHCRTPDYLCSNSQTIDLRRFAPWPTLSGVNFPRLQKRHRQTSQQLPSDQRSCPPRFPSAHQEWGTSGAARLAPLASARGLSLTLSPTWGNTANDPERLWQASDATRLGLTKDFQPQARVEAELGYGPMSRGQGFTVTPYLGFGYADTERRYRLGWRLTRPADVGAFGYSSENSNRNAKHPSCSSRDPNMLASGMSYCELRLSSGRSNSND